jgi:HSP20 family protein
MKNAPWIAETADLIFPIKKQNADSPKWLPENEGALALDVFDYPDMIVVRAPIAGVKPDDLDLALHNDMLTVRGKRTEPETEGECSVLCQECHWGQFSRSIILPVSVRADEAEAHLKDGVLTICLPKASRHGTIPLVPN